MAASKPLAIALAGAGVAGGAALALLAPSPPAKLRVDPQVIASELDGKLRETAAGVHSRAQTLAELPRLAAAVSTDAATMRDLAQDELAFRPRPGETITIGQVSKKPDGKSMVLLTLPAGATDAPQYDRPGARFDIAGGKLALTEVVTVTPRDRADEVGGVLAVSWTMEPTALAEKLDAVDAGARLELPSGALSVGKRKDATGAQQVTVALDAQLAPGAKMILSVPTEPAGSPPLRPVGYAVAALCALAGVLLARRKPVEDAIAKPATAPDVRSTPPSLSSSGGGAAGTQIGRYTIVKLLGSGGMAEVYLARATGEAGFEKLVALKVLHRALAAQPAVVEHFLDEARLASRLTHPNIVQIDDLGKAGDEYFIAMEYIDGADLSRLLEGCRQRGEQVPVRVGLAVVRKICDGLHAAHTATAADGQPLDLIHRDVKSANVFVAKNGVVKVGDFGIAKANVASRVNKTEIGTVKGTAAYMAPEHRLGQALDRRADLYAVGAIAYEILSGSEVNLDLAMLADRGREGWPHLPKLSEVRPDLPAGLDEIVFRALAYDKEARYADCAKFEEALDAVATQTGNVGSDKAIAQWIEAALAAQGTSAAAS